MPKSKRTRTVALSKTKKKGRQMKETLIQQIRQQIQNFPAAYVFEMENVRNNSLKQIRAELEETTRVFLGKTAVMAVALGKTDAEEQKPGLHKLAAKLYGMRGLILTKMSKQEIKSYFDEFEEPNYARAGAIAPQDYALEAGLLPADVVPFSMEPQVRKLGLPTKLSAGVVELLAPYQICKKGDVLTPEQCKLLEIFDQKYAAFRIRLLYMYEDGDVVQLSKSLDSTSGSEKPKPATKQKRASKSRKELRSRRDPNVMTGVASDDDW